MNRKPFEFESYLNSLGETVVYIKKGKVKHWLFNVSLEGKLDVGICPEKNNLYKLGLASDINGAIVVVGTSRRVNNVK